MLSTASLLWFERASLRLGIPMWAVSLLVGAVPFYVIFPIIAVFYGLWDVSIAFVEVSPVFLLLGLSYLLAARYTRLKIERLRDYLGSLRRGEELPALVGLYSFRGIILAFVLFNIISQAILIPSNQSLASYSPLQRAIAGIPWIIWGILPATLIWVWGCSMYGIWQMGRFSLELKPFAEDRTLGLRPFASTAMRLTIVYAAGLLAQALPNILFTGLPFQFFFIGLLFLGFVFFLFSLYAFHKKLIAAKQERLSWIKTRYSDVIRRFDEEGAGLDQEVSSELLAIKEVQRDVQNISTWPFDTGIFVRLLAVVLSVVGILIARIMAIVLHL